MTRNAFYVTTAIAYPNGEPHIGHAYEMIATDAIARWKRLEGRDVFFLTGTDEHGIKMVQTAATQGLTPRELADRNSARFRELAKRLDVSNDDFIRTTEPRHYAASQAIWAKMVEAGDIYQSTYKGWYSVRDEAYFDESELTDGEGGKKLAPSGAEATWVEEPSYFFRLSAYQDRLLAFYEANPDFIAPRERRNEVLSFVKGGLQDLSVSRTTFDWGIPVPEAPGHVMYVWVDALTNYITGVGFPSDEAMFHRYWPAFLISAGLALPKRVFAHGFVFNRGEKMSKSVGNVVDPFNLIRAYGLDPVRYFFLREVPFGQDGNYSHEAIVNRINADLANDLGNLAQRSLTMITRNCGAAVPQPAALTPPDEALLALADALPEKARAAMRDFALHTALAEVWAVVGEANRYFASQEPWILRKQDPVRMGTVLWTTAEVLRTIGILAQPFVPSAAAKLLDLLGQSPDARSLAHAGPAHRLEPGCALPTPEPIFPRYVEPET